MGTISKTMRKNSFPLRDEELLLQAALLSNQEAIDAWEQWKTTIDINDINAASQKLLPLLYLNLKKHGISDPSMDKMKGIYRYLWVKNTSSFQGYVPFFQELNRRNIPFLFLKGGALLFHVYSDFGLRGMQDIDVLIEEEHIEKAHQILIQLDIPCKFLKFRAVRRITPTLRSIIKGITFVNKEHFELDLHWRVLINGGKDITESLWEKSSLVQMNGISFHLPRPEILFFHICQHGIEYNSEPTFRWIADALLLLRKTPNFCWDTLQTYARHYDENHSMENILFYLKEVFHIDCPLPVEKRKDPLYEERVRLKPNPKVIPAHTLFWDWHCMCQNGSSFVKKMVTFPSFLAQIFGLYSVLSLFPYGFYLSYIVITKKKSGMKA